MKKIFILILVLFIILSTIETKAFQAKKIDLKLKEDETSIVFLNLKNSKSLLINDENSNLFILEYKNDKGLKEVLKIFTSKPDIFYLNKNFNKKIDNIYIFKQNKVLKFRINNYTLCVVNENKNPNCDFVYIMNLNKEFNINENILAVFYDENINKEYLNNVSESWVESTEINKESFTILKLNEESYNIVVVPSTNK